MLLFYFCFVVLVVRVMAAHDKGSHAEVEVKIKKVIYYNPELKHLSGRATLYPESWTIQGCTCPILNPGTQPPKTLKRWHLPWSAGFVLSSRSFLPLKTCQNKAITHLNWTFTAERLEPPLFYETNTVQQSFSETLAQAWLYSAVWEWLFNDRSFIDCAFHCKILCWI